MVCTFSDVLAKAARIQLAIFDVDGVLTDGRLYLGNDGNEFKSFHIRDGQGMKLLLDSGMHVAIISGRNDASVERRMRSLGVQDVYLGIENKRSVFHNLLAKFALGAEQVAYTGDDLIDLPVMTQVGLAIAVANADVFIKEHAHWQTPNAGGAGAVRDVCELLLEARGQLQALRNRYL